MTQLKPLVLHLGAMAQVVMIQKRTEGACHWIAILIVLAHAESGRRRAMFDDFMRTLLRNAGGLRGNERS